MSTRYVKTDAGRQAIRDRAQAQLSRPARNLLLIIDGQRTGAEWVSLVNGSSDADLQQLITGGLIEPARTGPAGAGAVPVAAAAAAPAPAVAPGEAGAQTSSETPAQASAQAPAQAPASLPASAPADSSGAPSPTPPVPASGASAPPAEPPKAAAGARVGGRITAELDALEASLDEDTRPVSERLQSVGYRHLYDTMTSQARPLLGLIKGYRMVLEVEKCNGPEELRRLALRFINEVRGAQGVGAAYRITEQLCRPPG